MARREFLTQGYQRTTVEGIGKAAGVSKQTIYRHFADKSEILRAIVTQAGAIFMDMAALPPVADSPLDAIAACAAPIRRSFLDGEAIGLFRLGISLAVRFQELASALNGQFVASLSPITDRMTALADDRIIETDDPLVAAAQLGGMAVEGTRYLLGHPAPAPDTFDLYNRAIADLYLNGLTGLTVALPEIAPPESNDLAANLHIAIRPYFPDAAEFRLSEGALRRLLTIARRKFFQAGYMDTSLDDIGAAARIGRGTLYRWFGAKEGLFKIAMLHAAAEIGATRLPAIKPSATTEQAMADIAFAVSTALTGRTGTALYRTVIAEASQFPGLAAQVHDLTRKRAAVLLTDLIAVNPAGRGLTSGQHSWLTAQFFTLATDGNRYLSLDAKPTAVERRAIASRAAQAFLYGHRKLR